MDGESIKPVAVSEKGIQTEGFDEENLGDKLKTWASRFWKKRQNLKIWRIFWQKNLWYSPRIP